MIYKFKSKASGDLIMLEENGHAILRIIGKSDPQALKQGIIEPAQMPMALEALARAVREEEAAQQEKARAARETGQPSTGAGPSISLRQRSLPFIRMLERCHAAQKEIVWGI